MVRHRRIALATAATVAGIFFAALAPAAGDQHVTGASQKVTYDADGVPTVHSGPQCHAGAAGFHRHRGSGADASDF